MTLPIHLIMSDHAGWCFAVLLQALLQKPNVTLPDVNAILSAALAQHNANVQVGSNARRADSLLLLLPWQLSLR
jgi:hypothetical protein